MRRKFLQIIHNPYEIFELFERVSSIFAVLKVRSYLALICPFSHREFGKLTDEAEIAFWTGILVAIFFLTQFLTSLLWAIVADRHGRRSMLTVPLLGSAVTCAFFGTSMSLPQAICIWLLQGIFAGAVGVARGSVAFVMDASNEDRAYEILGI
ncbi:hypothetical protein GYMLUDRAFT_247409 [Collybiopsis luxurians FD-317 M1]|uniref:Major facilitator superfamily (MFS) profile domain-containing protein n=1 Tax=Collybiopsis luxurians FD-317 M1 TaxID=944289 RepID=A0A0D0BP60_9AGAR|nr:hypothetical protein GYMLUDRAFT_247409 [Collybiopsis luxurians FD-317 M1]